MTGWPTMRGKVMAAMHEVDHRDLPETPDETAATTNSRVADLAHHARLLQGSGYPPVG